MILRNKKMIFSFENLGVISKGEIELGDLTILCGANNTGKTYVSYTLYGLLKNIYEFIDVPEHIMEDYLNSTPEYFEDKFYPNILSYLNIGVQKYKTILDSILGVDFGSFKYMPNINLKISYDEYKQYFFLKEYLDTFQRKYPDKRLKSYLFYSIVLINPFFICAERTGAVLFQQELNLAKSRLVDLFSKGEKVDYHGYALPVRDNIDFMNSLEAIKNQKSFLVEEYPEIIKAFDEIAGGNYQFNNGSLRFKPDATIELSMNGSSSSVRSLVILGYYLKHIAQRNDMLMIDEPELNLHPANQRKLTRLLARLVNVGIKVFMTTHSDYIVKEFNTLIMLSNKEIDGNKWGYSAEETLMADKVRVYTLQHEVIEENQKPVCTVKPADISPTLGIEVSTFDQTINEMNAIQDEIYYNLREKA